MTDSTESLSLADALGLVARAGRPARDPAAVRRHTWQPAADLVLREAARLIRCRAALSGPVRPDHLVQDLPGHLVQDLPGHLVQDFVADEARRALDLLRPEFDCSWVDREWKWTLRTEVRQGILYGLRDDGLSDALADAGRVPTDNAGRLLRYLCSGERVPIATEPEVAVQALAWASPLGRRQGDLAEARRLARIHALLESYRVLLVDGFVGRADIMAALAEFRDAPAATGEHVPILALTGVGGAGKSTVLARFVEPMLESLRTSPEDGPPPVLIDFDRLQFRLDAELELSFEVSRQLGMAHREAGADFSALRHQAREDRRSAGSDSFGPQHRAERDTREAMRFERDAGVVVRMHGLDDRPVVLILDTFEEWQRDQRDRDAVPVSSADPEVRLAVWLERLRAQMGLTGLRVVVSGRSDAALLHPFPDVSELPVGNLEPDDVIELLLRQGIERPDAERLAEVVGGNPLTLRVAAAFFRNLDAAAAEAFLDEGVPSAKLAEDLRRAVLFDRYLNHIQDPLARTVAHPGLVLRRITPAVVRQVLARVLSLDGMDDAAATALVRRLANEVWLVKNTPDGLLHQPDVRREMLEHILGDRTHEQTIRRIHAAAVAWYRSPDADLPREKAEVEALYHELMLGPSAERLDEFAEDRWAGRLTALGEAVTDLSPPVAAQVRLLRNEVLSATDAVSLPATLWEQWLAARGRRLVDDGRAAEALALFERRPTRTEPGWLAQACCDSARWRSYDRMVADFSPRRWAGRHAVVNAIVAGPDSARDCLRWVGRNIEHLEVRAGDPDELLDQIFFTLLLSAQLGEPWPHADLARRVLVGRARDARSSRDEFPVDQFRRVLCWAAAETPGARMRVSRLADVFRPDEEWQREMCRLARVDYAPPAMAGEPAGVILDDVARTFARRVGTITLDRETLVQPHVLRLFRGDNPELRPAVQLGLRSIEGDLVLADLAAIACELLPVVPADLDPAGMPRLRAPEAAARLRLLVEFVDRAGRLSPFLDGVFRRWPDLALVREVHRAVNRWEAVHLRLLDVLGRG